MEAGMGAPGERAASRRVCHRVFGVPRCPRAEAAATAQPAPWGRKPTLPACKRRALVLPALSR